MYKFGLIKDEGTWNTPSTDIYYKNHFDGYKPVQAVEIFGLINSTDGNFWLLSEDDDHYWTTAKISESTIRELYNKLINSDFSNKEMFKFENDLIFVTLNNLENNKPFTHKFHKDWIPSLVKTLDIDNPIETNKEILPVWEKSIIPDKIEYPLLTPEEYVYLMISKYPTLYAKSDFELSKFKVLDNLFNSLNSSTNDIEDFVDTISKKREVDIEKSKRYLNETSFVGYSKVNEIDLGSRVLKTPDFSSIVIENIFEEDKKNYPEVIHWIGSNPKLDKIDIMEERKGLNIEAKFRPYPNFSDKFSILWNNKDEMLNILSEDWIKEIVWFYKSSLEAINQGCFKDYQEFPTGSQKEDQIRIEEMKQFVRNKTFEQITKDYEIEYNGDMEDFLTKKWLKNKDHYINFINKIIDVFESELNHDLYLDSFDM